VSATDFVIMFRR